MSWDMYLAMGIATSSLYVFSYYLPTLNKVKKKLIKEGIEVKNKAMFNPFRIALMSSIYMIVFTAIFPFLLLGILFGNKDLKNSTEEMLLKEAKNA